MKVIPKSNVRRKALIIQNPGNTAEFIRGVLHDVERFYQYLTSNIGGAWEDDEITIMPADCNVEDIENYFNKTKDETDYYLILFSGHGSYSEDKGPICWLKNGDGFNHAWIKERVSHVPALFLTDSCQGIEKLNEGGSIMRKRFSAVSDSATRHLYRRDYDDQLRQLHTDMFVIGSSVSPGEFASENPKLGGYYIYSLITEATEISKKAQYKKGIYGIGFIHMLAEKDVEELSGGKQTPYLEGYNRTIQPPFMVKR